MNSNLLACDGGEPARRAPAQSIERVAETRGYDTIVIGARDLNMLTRALQGGVPAHVATNVPATVVVAR